MTYIFEIGKAKVSEDFKDDVQALNYAKLIFIETQEKVRYYPYDKPDNAKTVEK